MANRPIAAVVVIFAAALCAPGQHHSFRVYGPESGLNNLGIEDIAQDRQGYLWVASQGGLFRFDGQHFEVLGDSVGLPWYWSESLHCTRDGALLIASPNGLFEERQGQFHAVPLPVSGMSRGKRTIDSDDSGRIYLATTEGLLASGSYGGARQWSRIWPQPGAPPQSSSGVKVFSPSEVWFSCAQSLCLWNGRNVQHFGPPQGVPAQHWFAFVKDGRGRLLARSFDSLLQWVPERGRWIHADSGLSRTTEANPPFVDHSGKVLVPTDSGLAERSASGWRYLQRKNGLPVNVVTSLFEDREGNIWAGTYGGGIAQWIGYREWLSWTEAEGLPSEEVWSIVPESPSRYWIGTSHGVVVLEQSGDQWTVRTPKSAPHSHRVISLTRDLQGHLWAPSAGIGFDRVDDSRAGPHSIGASSGIHGADVYDLLTDSENRLWAATKKGLFRSTRLDQPEIGFTSVNVPGHGQPDYWWTVKLAADGTVWAAGAQGLLSVRDSRMTLYSKQEGLLADAVFVCQPANGDVWISYDSHQGITRLRWEGGRLQLKHFRTGNAYRTDRIYSMAADPSGRIYMGTGNGLLVFDGKDWNTIETGDGLIWPDCSQGGLLFDPQGALWIGTSRGLSQYRPQFSQRWRRAPVVFADAVLTNGVPLPSGSPPQLPFTDNSINFRFGGLTFTNWAKVLFRYRLAGLEDRWVETHARSVRYPALPPGRYAFEVRMRSAEGVWSEAPAVVPFEVLTPWWRSRWLIALCVALLALAGRVFYGWRVRVLHQRQHALQAAVQRGRQEIEGQKAEIERLLAKSEQANRAKSDFLANVSHELRTPLTGVIGMADLVLQSELEPMQSENLGVLRQSASGLLGILNDILDLSKVDVGRMELMLETFDPRQCVEEAVQTLAAPAQGKGIGLSSDWVGEVPERVLGDPLRLRQILLNLLGNAVKFTDTGAVTLLASCRRLEPPDERGGIELQFSVSDTGMGIPASQQAQIFEAFRQADNSLTRRYGGTGLGLAICKQLAELMDGRLWVESEIGRGSVFHVTLKMRQAPLKPAPLTAPAPAVAASGPRRILLVEDNAVNRRVIVGLLEKHGHTIESAENGLEALGALAKSNYDLVLMDVQMPVMDGLEATRRIRAMESRGAHRMPVVGLTALAMKGDREICLGAGMDECIHKPIDLASLLKAIERTSQYRGPRPSPHASMPKVEPGFTGV
jgi:signal transduction histidine kinase/CheY-like chemotaxis protein/ligand-binding sensor domain-containing protein